MWLGEQSVYHPLRWSRGAGPRGWRRAIAASLDVGAVKGEDQGFVAEMREHADECIAQTHFT